MAKHKLSAIALLICALGAGAAHAADALLDQSAQLIQAGKGKEAFVLLEPQESARAGDKEFDMLFALAALDAGQNTRAIFALERVLAVDPMNVRARAEIARAYFAVGENQNARNEFEAARKQGLPNDVIKTVDNFLLAIDRIENEGKTVVKGYVEASVGYDTNVNAGPAQMTSVVVGTPPIDVGALAGTKDGYMSIGGGLNFSSPLSKQWSLVGGASGAQRWNDTRKDVDLLNADANIGTVYTQDKNTYSLALQANSISVDNTRYRDSMGLTGQWQHNLDARNQISAFVQYADIRYIASTARNAERWVYGGGYAHATRSGALGFVSVYVVEENPRDEDNNGYWGYDGYGVRVGGQQRLFGDFVAFANLGYEMRRYNAKDPLGAGFTRGDDQWTLNLGGSYPLTKDVKATVAYAHTDQRSNFALYQYDRDAVSVAVRYDF